MKVSKRKIVLLAVLIVVVLSLFLLPAYASESHSWWESFGWFGDIANFVKSLVVPPANYFHNRLAKLNGLVNAKFSGLGQLYQILNDFFYKLGSPAQAELSIRIPNNFLFPGYRGFSMNFFGAAQPYIRFLRNVLTASCSIFTVVICYHKIRTFFTEEG